MNKQYPEIKEGVLDIVLFEDSDEVDLTLTEDPVRFQRIRRITGYLVGTLDRFNNAKRAEVEDRVKHSTTTGNIFESEYVKSHEKELIDYATEENGIVSPSRYFQALVSGTNKKYEVKNDEI